jgi:hypothetical protein
VRVVLQGRLGADWRAPFAVCVNQRRPHARCLSNLQHLKVSNCSKLQQLPDDLGGLSNLQRMDISDCRG